MLFKSQRSLFKFKNLVRNIKLVLEYDGSQFHGFQKQPHHPTVQEVLEKALSKLLNQKTKISAASSRTDAGVHAEHQVVNFKTSSSRSLEQIQKGLNALLPKTVAIKQIKEVPADFHARYSAKSKMYEYHIWNHPIRSPLLAGKTVHFPYALNLAMMRKGALLLKGRHDFRSFCAAGSTAMEKGNTVRVIHQFTLRKRGDLIIFKVAANGFLYHMVRNLVGTLLELGQGHISLTDLKAILHSKDRKLAGVTAPAAGLVLVDVTY